MKLFSCIDAATFSSRVTREEGTSVPDEFIRKVLQFPKSGEKAVQQARLSAIALEEERESTRADLRRDLHARRRDLLTELERVDNTLSELDRCSHGN